MMEGGYGACSILYIQQKIAFLLAPWILMIYYFSPSGLLAGTPRPSCHYQTRWKHILVDEYQDTNQAQVTL